MSDTTILQSCQLRPGDLLVGSDRTVLRVIRDGLFERNMDDTKSRRPWPKGKVEIMLLDQEGRMAVHYWGKHTTITVAR